MAQMVMLSDWHPDIIEFVVSKMQNPKILRWLVENSKDEEIREEARRKLKFTPLTALEREMYEAIVGGNNGTSKLKTHAAEVLEAGGTYEVENPDFLTGANISVMLTNEFMEAVKKNEDYELRYPDIENYTDKQKKDYDEKWHEIGDVREWEAMGYPVRVHRSIKAKDLWDLIAFTSTYSAEPKHNLGFITAMQYRKPFKCWKPLKIY